MSFWSRLLRNEPLTPELAAMEPSRAGPRFEVEIDPVMLYGPTPAGVTPTPAPRIDRRTAMQVGAVKRARDLVAGALGGLPLELYGPTNAPVRWPLFEQPEPDVPRSVTMTRTFEDLLFEGVAWWRILEFGWHGYPTKVVRLDPRSVGVQQTGQVYITQDGNSGMAWEYVPDAELIRFDSPNDPLLVAGARAIRTCLNLDAAAARYSADPMPTSYFTPKDGVDPGDDDEITEMLSDWQVANNRRVTAYVPAALQLNTVTPLTAEQMQLAESRQHAVLEIARCAGIDPEELGVSTTSRTYANAFDRRKSFLDFTLGAYRQAFEDRLSMGDVSARGYVGRLNLDNFLRTDPLSRYQAYAAGLEVGAVTRQQIAAAEGVPASLVDDGIPDASPVEEPAPPTTTTTPGSVTQ